MKILTILAVLAIGVLPGTSAAQDLRDQIGDLFSFGDCGLPLCLDGSISQLTGHGDHFLPSAAAGNAAATLFLANAIGRSVSNAPVSAASSGATFVLVGGVPVKTSTSSGPILAERSRTLGRGRVFVGFNVTALGFNSINGAPLERLEFVFGHQDVPPAGIGDPVLENDVIRVKMDLDLRIIVSSIFFTYGLTEFIDIGVSIPFVRTSIVGNSEAQVEPFGSTAVHFFGGTLADPVLRASTSISGSRSGIGDVAGRIKINLGQSNKVGIALLGDVRFATGDEANLLGSGATSVRLLTAIAGTFEAFSPHVNLGYIARTGEFENDAILAILGFDQLMTDWATLAVDIVSEFQLGENKIPLPAPIQVVAPFVREIRTVSIPERSGDVLNVALGMKFALRGGTHLVVNGIAPLWKNGLQGDFVATAGMEIVF